MARLPRLLLLRLFRFRLLNVHKFSSNAEIVELHAFVCVLLRVKGDKAEAAGGVGVHVAEHYGVLYPAKLLEEPL